MTTASSITDIHKAEKSAQKKIELVKESNAKKTLKIREEEEKKLQKMEYELRAAGKEKYDHAKAEATLAAEEKLKQGKLNDEAMVEGARSQKMEEAVEEGIKAFQEHISA